MSGETLDYAGRTVVVTGGGRGIGRAYARLLASRGASVVVADLGASTDGAGRTGEHPASGVVAEITDAGGAAIAVEEDIADEAGCRRIVDAAVDAFGGIDALINNAGIVRLADWRELGREEYQRHLDVHYYGTLWLTRAAWPHLTRSSAPRVVNTVSAAMLGNPMMVHYGSSKGAVLGLTRNLAVEGAADGVLVNAIAPGAGTRMVEASADSLTPEMLEHLRTAMSPELVAPVGAYLVHPASTVTGEVFAVAGGRVRRMAIVHSEGITDPDLSIEAVAAGIDRIMTIDERSTVHTVTPATAPTASTAPTAPAD